MLFLALKKVQMVKITSCQILTTQQKNQPHKICHCPKWGDPPYSVMLSVVSHHAKVFFKKILRAKLSSNFSLATKEVILGKLQYIKIFLVKLECLIIKKSLQPILKCWQCKHNYIDTYLHAKAKNFHSYS